MKDLIEDIRKKEFQKVYLLCGEEPYLRQLYKKKLTEAVLPEGDTMNLSVYTGKNVDPKAVIDQAETMPFFADKRLILLEDTGFFKNASPELADYIKSMPDTTCMVFVEEEVDKRGKLYKAVKSVGRIVEFGRQDERSLMRWILSSVKKEGKQITESAMRLFLEKAGDDMGNIQMELEKLFCYTLDKNEILPEDVEEICITRTENKIFDMIRAVAQKQQKKAMDLYYDLLALKEPPMRILFLIARQFNQLLQMKELKNQGYDQNMHRLPHENPALHREKFLAADGKFHLRRTGTGRQRVRRSRRSRQNRPHERPDERGNADCDVYDVDIRPIQCYYGKQKLTELFGKDVRENEAVSGCDHDRAGGPVSFWNRAAF